MSAIFSLEMKKILQDRGLLFWMLILPIAFIILATAIFASGSDDATKQQVILSIVPGYAVMFVFFIMISMVTTFLKDRDTGWTARIASTPISPKFYLLGKWIPFMVIVWIQIVVLLVFGKLVYQIPIEQPLLLLCLSLALAFTATGFGLALALIAKTENMGIAFTQVIALGGAMLGGLWVPLEFMPDFLQSIAHVLPQYWAHQAFQDALIGRLLLKDFWQAILIIIAFGCTGFFLAIFRYPAFLKQARG
jgi:ABC-2 type transport system permease protein